VRGCCDLLSSDGIQSRREVVNLWLVGVGRRECPATSGGEAEREALRSLWVNEIAHRHSLGPWR